MIVKLKKKIKKFWRYRAKTTVKLFPTTCNSPKGNIAKMEK